MDLTISKICDTTSPMESISRKTHGPNTDLNINSTGDSNFHLDNSQSGMWVNNNLASQVSSDFVELLKLNLSNFSLL